MNADVRLSGCRADDGLDIVPAVSGGVGPHDGEFVGQPGELVHRPAEMNARQGRRHGFADGSDRRRNVNLRIEGFELARPTLLKQEDHGLACERVGNVACSGARGKQRREGKPSETKSSDAQQLSSIDGVISVKQPEHVSVFLGQANLPLLLTVVLANHTTNHQVMELILDYR